MSITISAANYLHNTYQSTRYSGGEDQKGNSDAAGKTQQSSVSASLDQVNMGQEGIAVTEVSRQQGAEAAQRRPAALGRDTVDISAEGRAASLQGQPAAEKVQDQVEDLSEYTDTELKQLYYRGEITRQEYEDETGETIE